MKANKQIVDKLWCNWLIATSWGPRHLKLFQSGLNTWFRSVNWCHYSISLGYMELWDLDCKALPSAIPGMPESKITSDGGFKKVEDQGRNLSHLLALIDPFDQFLRTNCVSTARWGDLGLRHPRTLCWWCGTSGVIRSTLLRQDWDIISVEETVYMVNMEKYWLCNNNSLWNPKPVVNKLTLCEKGNFWACDVGCVVYGDSVEATIWHPVNCQVFQVFSFGTTTHE